MTKFVVMDDAAALDAAEAALRADAVIVLPTDTVYGLAGLLSSAAAVDRIYELKGRPSAVPIAVLVDSLEQAQSLVDTTDAATSLARAFWPGPLTIVLTRRGTDGTLGVRCPDHDLVRALARRVGPLAVTSANRHGAPTPVAAADAARSLAGDVALVIDGGDCAGTASTVVDATGPDLAILRAGPITEQQITTTVTRRRRKGGNHAVPKEDR